MDIASVIGIIGGFLLIVVSIAIAPGASAKAFIDYPSLVMVIGGAITALLTAMPLKDALKVFAVLKKVILNKSQDVTAIIQLIVSLAETARRDGLLALEIAYKRSQIPSWCSVYRWRSMEHDPRSWKTYCGRRWKPWPPAIRQAN
jgi:chemotaxis protein MotA